MNKELKKLIKLYWKVFGRYSKSENKSRNNNDLLKAEYLRGRQDQIRDICYDLKKLNKAEGVRG